MMKTILLILLFVSFVSTPDVFGQSADASWVGTYTFDEDGGRTVGGTKIFINHELVIKKSGNNLTATLQSNGYQTSKDLICTVKTSGNKLMLYFDSYGENNVLEPYRKGDLLLTLERRAVKGKTQLLTFWGNFSAIVPRNERTGRVYFRKS